MLEAMAHFAVEPFAAYFALGDVPKSSDRPRLAQAHILRTGDGGLIAIHLSSLEKFWTGLVAALEAPRARRPIRASRRAWQRIDNYDALGAELDARFQRRAHRRLGRAAGRARRAVRADQPRRRTVVEDPQVQHLGLIVPVEYAARGHAGGASRRAVRRPARRPACARRRCSTNTAPRSAQRSRRPALAGAGARRLSRQDAIQRNVDALSHDARRQLPAAGVADRPREARRPLPAARAREGAVAHPGADCLDEAQDDATLLAIRAQEEAGLDIITDGEIRRESYSNRFATALDGVDLDNPGTALDRSGHPNPVPRVVGPIRRRHPVEVDDLRVPARRTRTRPREDHGARPVHDVAAGADRLLRRQPRAGGAWTTPTAVNEEIRDLFAAGADIVQIDEPYMQARPDEARAVRPRTRSTARSTASPARPRCTSASATRPSSTRGPTGYSFLPELARLQLPADLDRDRAVEARLLACWRRCRARRSSSASSTCRDPTVETPETVAARIRRALPYVPRREHHRRAGLRHEVPAARRRLRQDASDGRGRPHRARGTAGRTGLIWAATFTGGHHAQSTNRVLYGAIAGVPLARDSGARRCGPDRSRRPTPSPGWRRSWSPRASATSRCCDVPVAINVFTAQEIESAGIHRPQDFIALTPNMTLVQTQNAGQRSFVVVRGISQARNSEPSVAVLVDGVLDGQPRRSSTRSCSTSSSIEVLKGPQGALYGRNAIGGAIIINTASRAATSSRARSRGLRLRPGLHACAAASAARSATPTRCKFRVSRLVLRHRRLHRQRVPARGGRSVRGPLRPRAPDVGAERRVHRRPARVGVATSTRRRCTSTSREERQRHQPRTVRVEQPRRDNRAQHRDGTVAEDGLRDRPRHADVGHRLRHARGNPDRRRSSTSCRPRDSVLFAVLRLRPEPAASSSTSRP